MDSTEITELLRAAHGGESGAMDRLMPVIYDELHALARRSMAGEDAANTLTPTVLVHEVFLRLLGNEGVTWDDRRHFFGAAANSMRRMLVDRARRNSAARRGGGRRRINLDSKIIDLQENRSDAVLALDRALSRLEEHDRRKADVVMLRYFAGLSVEDTASALGIAPRTVKREWQFARSWLFTEMGVDDGNVA